jgi:hypothetical protein
VTDTRALFEAIGYQRGPSHANYAVSRDNRRFVFVPYASAPGHQGRTVMVRNLLAELVPRLNGR